MDAVFTRIYPPGGPDAPTEGRSEDRRSDAQPPYAQTPVERESAYVAARDAARAAVVNYRDTARILVARAAVYALTPDPNNLFAQDMTEAGVVAKPSSGPAPSRGTLILRVLHRDNEFRSDDQAAVLDALLQQYENKGVEFQEALGAIKEAGGIRKLADSYRAKDKKTGNHSSLEDENPPKKMWSIIPPDLLKKLDDEFHIDHDIVPFPRPPDYDALKLENWPEGTIICNPYFCREDQDTDVTAMSFVRKCIAENRKGREILLLMSASHAAALHAMLEAGAEVRSLGRVKWLEETTKESMPSPSLVNLYILRAPRPASSQTDEKTQNHSPTTPSPEEEASCDPELFDAADEGDDDDDDGDDEDTPLVWIVRVWSDDSCDDHFFGDGGAATDYYIDTEGAHEPEATCWVDHNLDYKDYRLDDSGEYVKKPLTTEGMNADAPADKNTDSRSPDLVPAPEPEPSQSDEPVVEEAPPIPPWVAIHQDDTMEELDPNDLEEEPYDIAGELTALGPEPESPLPVKEDPVLVSERDDLDRFMNVLKLAFLGSTKGERDNGYEAASKLVTNLPDLIHRAAAAVEDREADPSVLRQRYDEMWATYRHLSQQYDKYYKREQWLEAKVETLQKMAEGRHKYKNPEAAKKHQEITAKNLDRAKRVVWHMRLMIQNMLRNGIPRTRGELDDLCAKAALSHAKEFRGWLEQVWTEIEAAPKNVPAEVTLLRRRNAALTDERDAAQAKSRDLQKRIDELEREKELVH